MSLQSLRADPEFQSLSPERQKAVLQQYVLTEREENRPNTSLVSGTVESIGRALGRREGESGPLGIAPDAVRAPEHTGSVLEEAGAPMRHMMGGETYTEKYLPKNFATTALSGAERAGWLGLGALGSVAVGTGNVIQKGLEQVPRLAGQPAASTPVSRAAGDVPGLVLQAMVPVAKTTKGAERSARAAQLRADAKAVGIDLTGAESTGSPLLRRVEGVVENLPFGSGAIERLKARQRMQTESAVGGVGPRIATEEATKTAGGAPAKTLSEAKVLAAQQQENARVATKASQAGATAQGEVSDFVNTLGPEQDSAAFLKSTQKSLRDAKRLARTQGNALYKEAEDIGGTRPVIRTANLADTASALHAQEAELGTLAKPAVLGASGTLKNIALEFSEQYGLNELQVIPYRLARILDSRLGAKIRVAQRGGDSDGARMLGDLQKALRADIDEVAANDQGELGAAMRKANEHWRTRYIEPFGPKTTIRNLLDTKEASKLDEILFHPQGAERIASIKAELARTDPGAWKMVERRFGDRLMRDSFNSETGSFEPAKFTAALQRVSPESLSAILGDKATAVNALRDKFQRAARGPAAVEDSIQAAKIFRTFAEAAPEVIVEGLAKQPVSRLIQLRTAMQPKDWSVMARSWWDEVILPKTVSETGVFSRKRFLTQLQKVDDEKLAVLLGDEAGENVATLRRVLREQEKLSPLGDNPPGSAKMALVAGQLVEAGALAGSIYSGDTTAMLGAGAIMLGPKALSLLLTSPTGSRLVVDAARVLPGTAGATQATRRIAIFLASEEARQTRAKNE